MCTVCPHWLSFILYNPIRKFLTDRSAVLDEAGVTAGSGVIEIGAGNGFFTEALARRAGHVWAVELQEGMVRKLRRRIAGKEATVTILEGDAASVPLPAGCDVAFLYYSFHEIGRQTEAAGRIAGSVKAGGLVAIYEPSVEVNRAAMDRTVRLFESEGCIIAQRRDGLFSRFALLRKGSAFSPSPVSSGGGSRAIPRDTA